MITMCENNTYFCFFDNFLQRFELWELQDNTNDTIMSFLKPTRDAKLPTKGDVKKDMEK